MTTTTLALPFEAPDLLGHLAALDDAGLARLDFGVIGFDAGALVRRYSAVESRLSGLTPDRVLGLPLFGVVAQCMNNYLVAQRFEDCAAAGVPLDETIDFVLTLRMKPLRVRLRMLYAPGRDLRYVCIQR